MLILYPSRQISIIIFKLLSKIVCFTRYLFCFDGFSLITLY